MFTLYCRPKVQYNHIVAVSLRVLVQIAGPSEVGILVVANSTQHRLWTALLKMFPYIGLYTARATLLECCHRQFHTWNATRGCQMCMCIIIILIIQVWDFPFEGSTIRTNLQMLGHGASLGRLQNWKWKPVLALRYISCCFFIAIQSIWPGSRDNFGPQVYIICAWTGPH